MKDLQPADGSRPLCWRAAWRWSAWWPARRRRSPMANSTVTGIPLSAHPHGGGRRTGVPGPGPDETATPRRRSPEYLNPSHPEPARPRERRIPTWPNARSHRKFQSCSRACLLGLPLPVHTSPARASSYRHTSATTTPVAASTINGRNTHEHVRRHRHRPIASHGDAGALIRKMAATGHTAWMAPDHPFVVSGRYLLRYTSAEVVPWYPYLPLTTTR
jgi:hypothetical protein